MDGVLACDFDPASTTSIRRSAIYLIREEGLQP